MGYSEMYSGVKNVLSVWWVEWDTCSVVSGIVSSVRWSGVGYYEVNAVGV